MKERIITSWRLNKEKNLYVGKMSQTLKTLEVMIITYFSLRPIIIVHSRQPLRMKKLTAERVKV